MLRDFKRYFVLVLPFIWMNSRCIVAGLTALFITLLDVLVVSVTPYLFSLLIRHYQTLSPTHLIGLIVTIAGCWFLKVTAKRFRSLFFFPVINQAIRTVRLRLITHYHHIARQESINYQSHEILSAATRISMSVRATMKIVFISLIPAFLKLTSCIVALYYFWDYSWFHLILNREFEKGECEQSGLLVPGFLVQAFPVFLKKQELLK